MFNKDGTTLCAPASRFQRDGLRELIPDPNQFSRSAEVPVSPAPHVHSHSIVPTTSATRLPSIRLDACNDVLFASSTVARLISTWAEAHVVSLVGNGVDTIGDGNRAHVRCGDRPHHWRGTIVLKHLLSVRWVESTLLDNAHGNDP